MNKTLRRFEVIPTVMTLAAFALMMSLGVWQLYRLEWKNELIASVEAVREMAPLSALPETIDPEALEFHPAALKGTFLNVHEFHLAPRYRNEKFGYHILTPLKLVDGRLILVNRGWVPAEKKLADSRPESLTKGKVTVKGMLRKPQREHWFMMGNKPDQNMWFWQDMERFSGDIGTPLVPVVLDAIGEETPGVLPVPQTGAIEFRNDHFGYALTWFSIAAGVLVIFFVYHRKRD